MNQAVAVKEKVNTVRQALEGMKGQFAQALPKHLTPERLCRVAMTAIQQTPKLLDCDRQSLYSAIMRSAQLGLEPDGVLGQAYLIPFAGKVQFIPGYRGFIDLARRSGEVTNIIAKEVYEADDFTVDWSQEPPFSHKPFMGKERGDVLYFWAMAKFKDGGYHWDFMTRSEVESIRDNSQGKNNDVWKKYFVEMGKKTMIRRIAKYLPMSVQRAAAFDELQESGKNVKIDDYGDIVIDGTAEEVVSHTVDKPIQGGKLDSFVGASANTEPSTQSFDPETGEVKEPVFIELNYINEKPDWASWGADFLGAIESAVSAEELEELKLNHELQLKSYASHNPSGAKGMQESFSRRIKKIEELKG